MIEKERRENFLVRLFRLFHTSQTKSKKECNCFGKTGDYDIIICEIGGTVGDIDLVIGQFVNGMGIRENSIL